MSPQEWKQQEYPKYFKHPPSTAGESSLLSSLAQGVQGLEVTITERVISEMQHVQDIFAMLEPGLIYLLFCGVPIHRREMSNER